LILAIYCAGSFGREIYDVAKRINLTYNRWSNICFVDNFLTGNSFYGAALYKYSEIADIDEEVEFIIANGEPFVRYELYNQVKASGYNLTKIIDPTATVSDTSHIGEGSIVLGYSLIASCAQIGYNVVVQPNSIIGHDIIIGDHSVISAGFLPSGGIEIGERVFIGMGVITKEKIKIGNDSIIGMGSVVYSDIGEGLIALGNPARVMRKNENKRIFK